METSGQRAKTVARFLGRAVAMAATLAAGVVWAVVYAAVRLLAASKRVWVCAALVGVGCLAALYLLQRPQPAPMSLVLSVAVVAALMHTAREAWVEYADKLVFLAEAGVHGRRLHAGPEWGKVWRGQAEASPSPGQVALIVLLGLVLVYSWWTAAPSLRMLIDTMVLTLAGVGFLTQAVMVLRVERTAQAAFYHRGWAVGDPGAWEQALRGRWPGVQRILAVRALLGEALAPVAESAQALLVPPGGCQG